MIASSVVAPVSDMPETLISASEAEPQTSKYRTPVVEPQPETDSGRIEVNMETDTLK